MDRLENLFNEREENPCRGCSVLTQPKKIHCYKDYEKLEEVDVLFVSDSFIFSKGKIKAFNLRDEELLARVICAVETKEDILVDFTASIKCPGVKDLDMPADRDWETIPHHED